MTFTKLFAGVLDFLLPLWVILVLYAGARLIFWKLRRLPALRRRLIKRSILVLQYDPLVTKFVAASARAGDYEDGILNAMHEEAAIWLKFLRVSASLGTVMGLAATIANIIPVLSTSRQGAVDQAGLAHAIQAVLPGIIIVFLARIILEAVDSLGVREARLWTPLVHSSSPETPSQEAAEPDNPDDSDAHS